ncbi:MAG TPA: lamin tail domain-containing protein [Pyrinomonadaceae bacterium]|nr:lamin tail domain-containing protein [Pyrinomonadaceae bacterium]
MFLTRLILIAFAIAFCIMLRPVAMRADTTVALNAVDSGWYRTTGFHDATNDNYLAGKVGAAGEFRNFLVFDLSSVRGPIKSATLRLFNPTLGYDSFDPFEEYTVYDVTTAIADLMASNDSRTDIHQDLGSGTSYGSVQVFDPSNNVVVAVTLNGNAISNLNASRGQFAFGGAITSLSGQDFEFIFGGSDNSSLRQLVLTVASPLLISEFRLAGLQGSADEFIELHNNDIGPLTVSTTDGSPGWALVSSDGVTRFVIPNGTIIPARGHYLVTNNSPGGYSLGDYGGQSASTGDGTYAGDIPSDLGLALFQTANQSNYTIANRLDAVGFSGVADANFREGTGLSPAMGVGTATQFSFVRKLNAGPAQDTDDNAADFVFLAVDQSGGAKLGAPGPENLGSPVQRNATIKASIIDPNCAGTGAPSSACARARDFTPVTNGPNGTLAVRRRFRNNTGQPVTRLRFRVVDMTTGSATAGTADLRMISSPDIPAATLVGGGTVFIRALTLEEPPRQPSGGGLNATVSDNTITMATPLGPGASVNVQFLLGVQQSGNFRFLVNVEGLTNTASPNLKKSEVKLKRR